MMDAGAPSAPLTVEPDAASIKTTQPFVIVTGDLVRTGGMDRANLALASYLARQGHPVHAVAHRVDPDLLAQPNVTFHRVAKPANSYLFAGPLLGRAGKIIGKRVASVGGRVVVNGGNCFFGDINWVHYVHAAYEPAGIHSLARRLKTAYSHRLFLASEERCVKAARVVIANSDRTKRDLIERVGVAAERIHTIYYGNDLGAFYPPSDQERCESRERLKWAADRPVVIFVGALGDRRKGFDTLFDAWTRLCRLPTWDADLVVVGRGSELSVWQQRAADARVSNRISFLGFRTDVPQLLRAADVLVAPTRYEAYGLGVQEALCCGLPALVSADAGVAERYPSDLQSLLLPDCEDAADLASRLVTWRGDAHSLQQASASLGDKMRGRTWDLMANEFEEVTSPLPRGERSSLNA